MVSENRPVFGREIFGASIVVDLSRLRVSSLLNSKADLRFEEVGAQSRWATRRSTLFLSQTTELDAVARVGVCVGIVGACRPQIGGPIRASPTIHSCSDVGGFS